MVRISVSRTSVWRESKGFCCWMASRIDAFMRGIISSLDR